MLTLRAVSNTSWSRLRIWKSSQNEAFEELCCQLAHTEVVANALSFHRKGTPDSGIECYWVLADGSEWGWQAKFFEDGFTDKRWGQCDESVKRVLQGHPLLKRLHFCVPYDFPDSRLPGKTSAEDRWNAHKKKWESWAKELGRELEVVLWGSFALTSRLSRNEHRGREWFWFNGLAMDLDWFQRHVAASSSAAEASDRYSSDFNVELPLTRRFEAIARTPVFSQIQSDYSRKLNVALSEARKHAPEPEVGSVSKFISRLETLLARINELSSDLKNPLNYLPVKRAISEAKLARQEAENEIWDIKEREVQDFRQKHGRYPREHDLFGNDFHSYRFGNFRGVLEEVDQFYSSSDARLASLPVMLLSGEAGQGKTQLLCTLAARRANKDLPTILMLGERFDTEDPWDVILTAHGLSSNRDTFLGALNSAGEACGSRSLILIDAINEGGGVPYWNRHLPAILVHLKSHPYVGFVVSVRDAYEADLQGMDTQNCVRVVHHGFGGMAGLATREFFRHYGLAEPAMPLLSPEFENPLLLKLLCRALAESGATVEPDTFGVTSVFDLFLRHTNKRLSNQSVLDYDETDDLVRNAVSRIAEYLAEDGNEILSLQVAKDLLNKVYPSNFHSKSLLSHLISEHVLVRLPLRDGSGGRNEGIRFAYQRLGDHLIVGSILAKNSAEEVPALFQSEGIFEKRIREDHLYGFAGWLEALAIQLPERYGIEIDQIPGLTLSDEVTFGAFKKSLVWRKTGAFREDVIEQIETCVRSGETEASEIFDELMAITAKPNHPLNADWLDRQLHDLTMADRDAFWSIFLFGQVNDEEKEGGVLRLIEWAWSERSQEHFSDDVVRLAGMTLIWCLTTSDRFVRDRATKALVSLLMQRLRVLTGLIRHFDDVDEPYLQERLYAVAYGCAMLTSKLEELEELATITYEKVFRDGSPPASVLLRDHARGLIECARCRIGFDSYDPEKIVPPYGSGKWTKSPPTIARLEKMYNVARYDRPHQSLHTIYHSVTGGDFLHYVIKDVTRWSRFQKGVRRATAPRVLFAKLKNSLPYEHARILDEYAKSCRALSGVSSERLEESWCQPHINRILLVEANLRELLGGEKRVKAFQEKVAPYLKELYSPSYSEHFDIKMFQRLILSRVLELGWTTERFGVYDSRIHSAGREARKAERMGKKYQWIAYDEYHARISDNFGPDDSENTGMSIEEWKGGLWPLDFRDLDPSLLLKRTFVDGWGVNHRNWWTPYLYDAWTAEKSFGEWLRSEGDLPPPGEFLTLKGPDGSDWFSLKSHIRWKRDEFRNFDGAEPDNHEMHYIFRSYLTRKEHLPQVLEWGAKQDWINERLPSPSGRHRQHLHEHNWSSHFDSALEDEWLSEVWRKNDLPYPILETTADYLCESGTYDCSIDESVFIAIPSRWITEKMGVRMAGRNGDFCDGDDALIFFDPSTREEGTSALVVQKNRFSEFLHQEGLAIFWTLLGEKNIYPADDMAGWPGRLTLLGIYSSTGEDISGAFRSEFKEGRD